MKNDLYLQLLESHEILNDVIKMNKIKISMDSLDIDFLATLVLKNRIIELNRILNAFVENIKV